MPIIYLIIFKRYYYTKIVLLSRCTNSLNRTFHFISLLWVQHQCHTNTDICGLDCESADNNSVKKHQEIPCFFADCYHGTNYAHVLHLFGFTGLRGRYLYSLEFYQAAIIFNIKMQYFSLHNNPLIKLKTLKTAKRPYFSIGFM